MARRKKKEHDFSVTAFRIVQQAIRQNLEPKNYKDLMVRIVSYCTYFVDSAEEQRLDIINLTAHQGW